MTYIQSCFLFPLSFFPSSSFPSLEYHHPALLISIRRDRSLDLLEIPQRRIQIPSILHQTHGSVLSIHPCSLSYLFDKYLLSIVGFLDAYSVEEEGSGWFGECAGTVVVVDCQCIGDHGGWPSCTLGTGCQLLYQSSEQVSLQCPLSSIGENECPGK
jgi:hypothetical protein